MRPQFLFLLIIFVFLLVQNCSRKPYIHPSTPEDAEIVFPEDVVFSVNGSPIESVELEKESTTRFVQYEAYITISSSSPDSVHQSVLKLVNNFKGYVLKSEKDMTIIRVPSADFSEVVKEIEKLGIVANKEIKGEDVTEEYHDLTIRLESTKKVRDRYLELLKIANSVESALQVEREIERVNKEIDLITGKLNRLQHLVRFSTISVSTAKEVKPGPIGYIFYGAYKVIKWLFVWD